MFIFNVWSESEKISFDSPDDDPLTEFHSENV